MPNLDDVPRIDVFSLKGGAGKTTLAFQLARAFVKAHPERGPALLIDADLTGTCLGDLLQPIASEAWSAAYELDALLCDAPEQFDDLVRDALPVFAAPQTRGDNAVVRLTDGASVPSRILFAPSHPYATARTRHRPVDLLVLHGLIGQESAGHWVERVFGGVIDETHRRLGENGLGLVVVDHAPGIGALQKATLDATQHHKGDRRHGVVVTTRDLVDLRMVEQFHASIGAGANGIRNVSFVVNRVPSPMDAWEASLPGMNLATDEGFLRGAIRLLEDGTYGSAHAGARDELAFDDGNTRSVEALLASLLPKASAP